MKLALSEAELAAAEGEIPVGAAIADENGKILSRAHNRRETDRSATAHAELLAIEAACRERGNWRLEGCTLYVTLEPCPMCAGAIANARIGRVVYGARNPREGACGSVIDLYRYPLECRPEVEGGVMERECLLPLQSFFTRKREIKEKDPEQDPAREDLWEK